MSRHDLVHEVASKVFHNAKEYNKARPGYKRPIVDLFLEKLGLSKVSETGNENEKPITLLELAAGTGQFTKALVEVIEGTSVQRFIASEPVESMSKVLKENNPGVEFMSFRSEHIRKYKI